MIVVKVELHSAITGRVKLLGQMIIANDGTGSDKRGNYWARTFRVNHDWRYGGYDKFLQEGKVTDYPRLNKPIWSLVKRALNAMTSY